MIVGQSKWWSWVRKRKLIRQVFFRYCYFMYWAVLLIFHKVWKIDVWKMKKKMLYRIVEASNKYSYSYSCCAFKIQDQIVTLTKSGASKWQSLFIKHNGICIWYCYVIFGPKLAKCTHISTLGLQSLVMKPGSRPTIYLSCSLPSSVKTLMIV